jgi:2-polyprenyl-3-methyl-5-hydroxy-6-metoxy-1,4-benzoquinol methylase
VCKTRDRNWRLSGEFTLVRCRECGLVYIDPRPTPEEMSKYYPEAFTTKGIITGEIEKPEKQDGEWEKTMAQRARPLLKRKSGGNLLDIGCADGIFLIYMRKQGWKVFGVEPREVSALAAREKFGLDVFNGYVEDANYPAGFFDAITLNHVFEHIHNPANIASLIRELLAPCGLVMIEVPNFAGLESRVFGERWVAVDAPRHLYQFTPKTLRAILEINGLRVLEIIQGSDIGRYKMGYSESLRHVIADVGIKKYPDKPHTVEQCVESNVIPKRSHPALSALHTAEYLLFSSMGLAANTFKMGGRIIAIATKD